MNAFILLEKMSLLVRNGVYDYICIKTKNMLLGISYTEWVGYAASLVLIISFMMKNVNTLRTINSVGAFVFIIYGIMLGLAWPIIITNAFVLGLNLYYLLIKKD